jgi:hypothetical protein
VKNKSTMMLRVYMARVASSGWEQTARTEKCQWTTNLETAPQLLLLHWHLIVFVITVNAREREGDRKSIFLLLFANASQWALTLRCYILFYIFFFFVLIKIKAHESVKNKPGIANWLTNMYIACVCISRMYLMMVFVKYFFGNFFFSVYFSANGSMPVVSMNFLNENGTVSTGIKGALDNFKVITLE